MRLRKLTLAALAVALVACSRDPGDGRVPAGTPVVLISIDTLRADHLPAWGYSGVKTPAIDGLRRDGILFSRAYAHTPLTLPSHTSMLTGLLPGEHGVRDNVGYSLAEADVTSQKIPYLPKLLKDAGYATGAGVSAYVLRRVTGLAAAFDTYEDAIEFHSGAGLGGQQRKGGDTLTSVRPWLESVAKKPFFLFFHIYEPHTPYEPPERFRQGVATPYDGEIAAADEIVGNLIADLRRLGVYDQAVIILVSDHGEGLGEHGEEEHGLLLYNEDIHIPLLVKLPRGAHAGATVDAPAGLFDIPPTIAALLGLQAPASWQGTSLVDLLRSDAPRRRMYSETFYPRLHFGWSDLASLIDGTHHVIEGPGPEVYDLAKDPRERVNVLLDQRRVYADMKKEIEGLRRELQPPAAVDEETRQAMAALGYLGGGGEVASGDLPDPKTQLHVLADLKRGFQQLHEKRWADAERTFLALVGGNPQMIDAWEFLGRARLKQGQPEAALEAYEEALRRSGGSPNAAMQVASILFDLERLDDAAAHAKLSLANNPSYAHGMLARIALRRKDLATAESEARLALEDRGQRVGPLKVLAEVLYAKQDHAGALDAVRQAREAYAERETQDPDLLAGLSLIEGKIHADLGDAAAAERAFAEEMRLFPENISAYSNMALVYALTGRPTEATAMLRRMTEAMPSAPSYAEAARTYRALGDERGAQAILRYARRRFPDSDLLKDLERAV